MDAIYIPQLLHLPEQTLTLEVREYLPSLQTLTPAQGEVRISHHGNYLDVSARAEAIVTLTCDRCLQQYNHRLTIDVTELIWLSDAVEESAGDGAEQEILLEDLVETLPPKGHFNLSEWLYEQFCLAIPQRQLCEQGCPGIQVDGSRSEPLIDRRWASLEALKREFSNN